MGNGDVPRGPSDFALQLRVAARRDREAERIVITLSPCPPSHRRRAASTGTDCSALLFPQLLGSTAPELLICIDITHRSRIGVR
ncbi:unnamed protein product [Nippostrongylus brasiliensis]|uniref:Uncharacterized protein n=1 Tax=Nippostrongylus brasiliensis TaxID=27835 RepID=A0A0N4Y0W9_NIPBR|nr:unnamed protein product [Nippostrongylus brasiliensis]